MSVNESSLILPVAGASRRFPNMRPKFLLTHPSGCFMLTESIRGLSPSSFKKIVIIALKDHENKYRFTKGIIKEIQEQYNISEKHINIVLMNNLTKSQAESVYVGLKESNIRGSILIKDCDNYFDLNTDSLTEKNFVAVGDLNKEKEINPGNKSYVALGSNGTIENIVEKEIINNLFCAGAYYFNRVDDYYSSYKEVKKYKYLYISHIIYNMLINKNIFFTEQIKGYIDWGTKSDWKKFINKYGTIFVDLDGVLVYNSGKNFVPKWGETDALQKNVNCINKLYESGRVKIIITTAREKKNKNTTIKQLKKCSIKFHDLYMGLPHGKRILINDYSSTNSYPSAIAINIKRDNNSLFELLSSYFD